MDSTAQLHNAQSLLQDLGNALSNLVNASPEIFTDEQIQRCLQDFQAAYQEAAQRLAHPSLVIATLGTTSSGKSTIVNALMGRRIAPIEAGEMSGGILHLKHSEERRLVVEETPEAVWETGEWSDLGDAELYARIQTVMNAYHRERRKRDLMAPQVRVQVPLLPARDLKLSGLPEGVEIEFLDLPGLKSVQDRANLAVIQEQMGKAFSLVALDYMQVDEQHRQKLLGELKQVVEYLGGRTDAMIFILNRVDNRGADDLPLETRLEQLKVEIKEILGLETLPDVIPFSARLLYYAQCAWGTTPVDSSSETVQADRHSLLSKLLDDCNNFIRLKSKGDRYLRSWKSELEDKVEDGDLINDEDLQELLGYALEWSGGLELWQCVRTRLDESFSSLVIYPALVRVFACYELLASLLDILIQNRQIENREAVEHHRDEIARIRQTLQQSSKRVGKDFQQEVKDYIDALKSNDLGIIEKAKKKAQEKSRNGFGEIFGTVSDVEGEITASLVAVVRGAFEGNMPCYDLEEQLQAVISPILAHEVARAYDKVYRRIQKDFSEKSGMFVRQVRSNDDKAKEQLAFDEKCFRMLYFTMRKAITARAEFVIQAKAVSFETALQSLVEDQLNRLQAYLSAEEVITPEMEDAIMSDLRKKLTSYVPKLPQDLFIIDADISQQGKQQREVVGRESVTVNKDKYRTRYKTETYEEGSCLSETKTRSVPYQERYTVQETETRNVYDQVDYLELSLPTPKVMAKQWLGGVTKGKDRLWDILCDWITSRLNEVELIFEESVMEITALAERLLNDRLNLTEAEFEEQKQLLEQIQSLKQEADAAYQKLKKV